MTIRRAKRERTPPRCSWRSIRPVSSRSGLPLAAGVRGPDAGYAGYPDPAAAALRALAEAWRGEPTLTRRIVEAHAATVDSDARDELSRVPDIPLAEIQPLSDVHGARYVWRALEPVELLQAAGRWADAATVARRIEGGQPAGEEGGPGRRLAGAVARSAELAHLLAQGPPPIAALREHADAVRAAITLLESSTPDRARDGHLRSLLDGLLAFATSVELLLEPVVADPAAAAAEVDRVADVLAAIPSAHTSGEQRQRVASAWRIAALLLRYDNAVRAAALDAHGVLQAAKRQAEVMLATIVAAGLVPETPRIISFLEKVHDIDDAGAAQTAWQTLALVSPPVCLVGASLEPQRGWFGDAAPPAAEPPRAVCVPTVRGVPVTDVLVVRPRELYHLGMTVRIVAVPDWAETCIVEPVTTLGRNALALPPATSFASAPARSTRSA
jgi:hypothetical protein